MSKRDNQTWLSDLRTGGDLRDTALVELHDMLISTLPYGLSRWLSPADPQFNVFIEDVTQETLMRVFDGMDSFEGRSQFTTWAYKIAVRVALSELRRRRWRDVSLDELTEEKDDQLAEPSWMSTRVAGPESTVERREVMARIQQIITEELPPKQRQALMAVAVNGVPMDEVARRMNTNRNALYKLMHDARLRLKHRLEQEGLSPEELLKMFEQK
jgi:RNA polymerase sigma-70 factor, ECF subfamily